MLLGNHLKQFFQTIRPQNNAKNKSLSISLSKKKKEQ